MVVTENLLPRPTILENVKIIAKSNRILLHTKVERRSTKVERVTPKVENHS
jgi:hypothetical protein